MCSALLHRFFEATATLPLCYAGLSTPPKWCSGSVGPQHLSPCAARVSPPDRSAAATVWLKLRRQAQVLVSSANQQIAGEVGFVQALLDDDLVPLRRIIEARAHRAVPPFHRRRSLRIRRRLVNAVGVIDYDVVATFSLSRRHRHDDPVAGPVIFKPLLLVLIVSELEPVAPALLIPVRSCAS